LFSLPEKLPVLQNAGSRLGVLWNKTEMSSNLNLEQADKGTWRRKVIFRSDLARKLPHKWLETGGGGAIRECLHSQTNQERLGCDVTVSSLLLELGES
jgi:hypothetical protein